MDQKAIALAAAKALDAKRGKDIVVLKVDEMTVITDYMVIATGRSSAAGEGAGGECRRGAG
ncbi:MAG: RsfS/YbeB/iojap family protein [Christensenellales bacterium]